MNLKMKKILLILVSALVLPTTVYAFSEAFWEPDGTNVNFHDIIPETISTTGAKQPEIVDLNGDNVLSVSHEKNAEVIIKKDMTSAPITFHEYKDYVLSFSFQTDVLDGFREIMHYDGDIGYQASKYVIRIAADADNSLYIKDLWGDNISKLELNTRYHIKCLIDGESRRIYEIRVNDEVQKIDLYHFHHELPETVDNFNIVQKSWQNTGSTYYDNLCFREIDKTQTNVFFKTNGYKEASAFSAHSDIGVCAAIYSDKEEKCNLYLALYDDGKQEFLKMVSVNLVPGMNYPYTDISVDNCEKTLKVYLWDDKLKPFGSAGVITGNSNLLKYKSRVKSSLLERGTIPANDKISGYLNHIDENGKFDNLTYTARTADFCYEHCRRLWDMARVLAMPDNNLGTISRGEVQNALKNGIAYWVSFDTTEFKFDNWYYENIVVPEFMGKVLLLLSDTGIKDVETYHIFENYMHQKIKEINAVSKSDTGSNILQMQRNKSYFALYLEDTNMLLDAFKRINKELRPADSMNELGDLWRKRSWENMVTVAGLPDTNIGIQSDYSYLFHGPQLLSGTYGLTFLHGVCEMLNDTKDLHFFPKEGIKNITDFLLEHYTYIGRGTTLDYSTIGRIISDKDALAGCDNFNRVYEACEYLLNLENPYRREELIAFANSKPTDNGTITPAVTGHKYFNKADYTAHVKKDYLFTVKASSARTLASESLSYSNLKGRHLGDGVTFIYRTGREYNDIFAALNWHRLPGTTSEEKDFETISTGNYSYESTKSQKVGGISFHGNGATAMELIRDTLSAKKSWFMFDDAVVCLGAGIGCETDNAIYTSVNQCLSAGDAKYTLSDGSTDTLAFDTDEYVIKSPKWVLHDGIGYIFHSDCNIYAENAQKQGDRFDISWNGSSQKPKTETVKRNIFSLWLNHKTDHTTSYEYIIVPDTDESSLDSYVVNNTFKIISNTSAIQAAQCENEMQAVFWEGGNADFGNIKISANASCIIAAEVIDGNVTLTAAVLNPEVKNVTVTVENGTQKIYQNTFSF